MDIILCDIDEVFLDWAGAQLEPQGTVVTEQDLASAASQAKEHDAPCLLLLGPNLSPPEALATVRDLDRDAPHVACVFVAAAPDPQLLTDALRAGVDDVLTYPFDSDELIESVLRASTRTTQLPKAPDPTEATEPGVETGKVVTVFSTKGGSGKSLVASNLALLLRRKTGSRVVLVDLDLQSGDIAILLDIHAERGMLEATERVESLDADALAAYLTPHPSGIHVLTAPTDPSMAELITGEAVLEVLAILRTQFDWIVIDGPAQFTEQVLAAFDVTDTFVLMASLDVPSIKNLRVAMNTLDQLGTPRENIRICVNRANTKVGLSLKDVRKALGTDIHVTIPSSRDVPLSYNAAAPLAMANPRSDVVLAIENLLAHVGVVVEATPPTTRRRFLR